MSCIKANIKECPEKSSLKLNSAELGPGRYYQKGDLEVLIHSALKSLAWCVRADQKANKILDITRKDAESKTEGIIL